ncbi:MAG: hypothetical protein H6982_02745 [Chromatiales bacterium]|nr:hypothetical protein [Chromatiales bacterium]
MALVFYLAIQSAIPVAARGIALAESFDGPPLGCLMRNLTRRPAASIGTFGRDSNGVRIRYQGIDKGSERTVFSCPLGERGLEYALAYDVRFEPGFQFVKGGKLHGLGPDAVASGGKRPRPDEWSARVAFRPEGGIEAYVYHQDQKGRFGEIFRARAFRFVPGRYYRVELQVRVNSTSALADGHVRLLVDDELLVDQGGLRFRGTDGNRGLISRFLFSTFHGGGSPEWAPRDADGKYVAVFASFDNFEISRAD